MTRGQHIYTVKNIRKRKRGNAKPGSNIQCFSYFWRKYHGLSLGVEGSGLGVGSYHIIVARHLKFCFPQIIDSVNNTSSLRFTI